MRRTNQDRFLGLPRAESRRQKMRGSVEVRLEQHSRRQL